MAEQPVLMENTKIHTFSIWDEKVYNRNKRFFRPVYRPELTSAMLVSAGLSPNADGHVDEKPAEEVVEVAPPATESEPKTAPGTPERPDFTDWDEDRLREFTESMDIPTHPAARKAGLQAAITRYFDELSIGEGNQSTGNGDC